MELRACARQGGDYGRYGLHGSIQKKTVSVMTRSCYAVRYYG